MSKEWKKEDPSGTRWRIADPEGDSVSTFDVEARRPGGQIPFSAQTITFKVNVHGETKEYVLRRVEQKGGLWEPELLSPPHLEQPATNKKVLRIKEEPDVWISEVQGDGQPKYTFTAGTGPIDIRVTPQD